MLKRSLPQATHPQLTHCRKREMPSVVYVLQKSTGYIIFSSKFYFLLIWVYLFAQFLLFLMNFLKIWEPSGGQQLYSVSQIQNQSLLNRYSILWDNFFQNNFNNYTNPLSQRLNEVDLPLSVEVTLQMLYAHSTCYSFCTNIKWIFFVDFMCAPGCTLTHIGS